MLNYSYHGLHLLVSLSEQSDWREIQGSNSKGIYLLLYSIALRTLSLSSLEICVLTLFLLNYGNGSDFFIQLTNVFVIIVRQIIAQNDV